jgi:hypothetical protein
MKDLKGNTAPVEIFMYAFDEEGMVRDRLYQALTLDLKKVGDKLHGSGLKYYATLTLPPGKYAVKSLVRVPETDRKGYVRSDLVVGKPTDVEVLPAIYVDEHPKWVLVKGTSHAASAAYPFSLSGEQFIPAVTPRDTTKFAVFVHNARANEVTFDKAPNVKFLGAAQSGPSTALVMQLEGAGGGELTVHAKGATQKVALQ